LGGVASFLFATWILSGSQSAQARFPRTLKSLAGGSKAAVEGLPLHLHGREVEDYSAKRAGAEVFQLWAGFLTSSHFPLPSCY